MSFWKELSRRNVVKVGIAYAVAAWLIIHPVDIVFPILHLPEWSITLVAAFLMILFPLVLIFSWVYEVTPKGLKRTKEVPISKSITHLTGKRLNYIITGLLVLAVAYLLFDKYYLNQHAIETKEVSTVSEVQKAKKTVAVLPFADDSPNVDQGYFVNGLSEEILNNLAQIPDLNVIGRTSSFSFKGSNKTVQEIASVLGADHILEGSVRKAGNALRITAQLLRATDSVHLWSKTYDRELKDIFAVQEDIAKAVADELKVTLGVDKSLKQLGGTDNVEAYELYLAALGQVDQVDSMHVANRNIELLNAAITLDPQFALAWVLKSMYHTLSKVNANADGATTAYEDALFAAQKAVELEPNLSDGYFMLGILKWEKDDFIDGESDFRKAFGLTTGLLPVNSIAMTSTSYNMAGHFKKAHEILAEARKNDPLNQIVRQQYILNLAFQNDLQGAEEEYERGMALLGDKWKGGYLHITMVRLGAGNNLSSEEILYSDPIFDVAKEYLESPEQGLEALRRITKNEDVLGSSDLSLISLWAAYFGDPDFAMNTMEKSVRINSVQGFFFWFPVMHEVRQTPRFKAFVKKIGLVDYWNKFGWPDICHQLDNGDFKCD